MKTRIAAAAVTAMLIDLHAGHAAQAACPSQLGGKSTSSNYNFEYLSWLRPADKNDHASNAQFQFGGTIKNYNQTPLWVAWPELKFSGFVKSDRPTEFSIGDPTGDCDVVQADIWYGDAPAVLDKVSAIRPKAKGIAAKIIQTVSDKLLKYFAEQGKIFTNSHATLLVPLDQETPPKDFARVSADFYSEITPVDYKLGLRMTVDPDDRSKAKNFIGADARRTSFLSAVIDDSFVAQSLKMNRLPYAAKTVNENQLFTTTIISVSFAKPEPVYRVGQIVFEDWQHRRIGSMPIAILEPGNEPTSR